MIKIPAPKIDIEKKYNWHNWSTVEELSNEFNRSKRRIQQIIVDLGIKVERGILVIDNNNSITAIPIYRRTI